MTGKVVAPAINETAFNCPHCKALAIQYWHSISASRPTHENVLPLFFTQEDLVKAEAKVKSAPDGTIALSNATKFRDYILKSLHGSPHLSEIDTNGYRLSNLHISRCFHCQGLSIWLNSNMILPLDSNFPEPNEDLPADLKSDYNEAGAILNLSPRGAAALLRLVVQKLCKELGESGKNIDKDIGTLVAKGLDPLVQQIEGNWK